MRRLLAIAMVILPPAILLAVLALSTPMTGLPGPVTTAVNAYLQYRASLSQPPSSIQQIVPAGRPGRFTPQMSKATFGDSVYFQTSHRSASQGAAATATPWPGEISWASGNLRPLPFPPVALWCVLLQPADPISPSIVFVAQHQDDYKADWIVHEPAAQTAQVLTAELTNIGCDVVEGP